MSAITLHYFDGYGRAESIRMMFHHHGTHFTDHRIQSSEWPPLQSSGLCEFSELPVLECDGLRMSQTRSISRYVAQKLGYGTSNHYDEYLVESICDLRSEILQYFLKLLLKKDLVTYDKEINSSMVEWLQLIEARLVKNNGGNGWFVGNKITRADFEIFESIYDFMIRDDFGNKYSHLIATHAPKLNSFMSRFRESSHSFSNYMNNRPKSSFQA
ncbi:hypothetical protein SteCoe_12752 [Stentor coeruleus]|uniref:Glutathione transferase n=1 Tax=Stentor coeruleus TaxID=5963 RepID=A0A1R2CA03_9CILI|nr:hypothetical protein SteCoe_12752 [Stentor coeruleus]